MFSIGLCYRAFHSSSILSRSFWTTLYIRYLFFLRLFWSHPMIPFSFFVKKHIIVKIWIFDLCEWLRDTRNISTYSWDIWRVTWQLSWLIFSPFFKWHNVTLYYIAPRPRLCIFNFCKKLAKMQPLAPTLSLLWKRARFRYASAH